VEKPVLNLRLGVPRSGIAVKKYYSKRIKDNKSLLPPIEKRYDTGTNAANN
jgi:hypothetical protein